MLFSWQEPTSLTFDLDSDTQTPHLSQALVVTKTGDNDEETWLTDNQTTDNYFFTQCLGTLQSAAPCVATSKHV